MAKKGGVQQLQADISTDEDLEKFLERPGLIVLDVYSEWCGPCLGMVGSLRKIKLEIGGDNLQLAIVKSDTVTPFKRFNKKSEPTWIFITNGKVVNLMFGTNVPRLTKMITHELNLLQSRQTRPTYELGEMLPEEIVRYQAQEEAIAEAARIEFNEKEKQRREYLTYVTDTIMDNLPDIGITVFGPQVSRDMFKKLSEPADHLKLQCKDRKVVQVFKENFDIVNFACHNPLSDEVIDQLHEKELLICFWKMPENWHNDNTELLYTYANELTRSQVEPPDEFHDEEIVIPPIISAMKVKIEIELEEGEEYDDEDDVSEVDTRKSQKPQDLNDQIGDDTLEDFVIDEEEGEEDGEEPQDVAAPELDLGLAFDLDLDGTEGDNASEAMDETVEIVEETIKKPTRKKTIIIPPVWIPNNHRTHAALIYVFFRSQTTPFLPPDPVPEPPHVVMAFDAYKRKDLIDIAERYKSDIPLYGFFTSDNVDEAKFIANSEKTYATQQQSPMDKIIFKVNKQTSHIMLSLATYGPSYISPNTIVGKEEALKLFPEDYKTFEQEMMELQQEESKPQQKRKKKGATDEQRTSAPHDRISAEATTHAPVATDTLPRISEEETAEKTMPKDDETPTENVPAEVPLSPEEGTTETVEKPETTETTEAAETTETPDMPATTETMETAEPAETAETPKRETNEEMPPQNDANVIAENAD